MAPTKSISKVGDHETCLSDGDNKRDLVRLEQEGAFKISVVRLK